MDVFRSLPVRWSVSPSMSWRRPRLWSFSALSSPLSQARAPCEVELPSETTSNCRINHLHDFPLYSIPSSDQTIGSSSPLFLLLRPCSRSRPCCGNSSSHEFS
ncbi:hypothetical protein DL93DRAFT_1299962 [Clavulina sp. PMI_390]|nr:hypothetical protein DL93DRAFT_1299962 [Clavulina sp. PMI_390]